VTRTAFLIFVIAIILCGAAAAAYRGAAIARRTAVEAEALTGGDVEAGRAAVKTYGCDACHTIPGAGVVDARGLVGPPLTQIANRIYIAGVLTNTPDNLIEWIQNPPGVDPRTAMPNLGVGEAAARDIAAYLYTLR
jgi:cytochrome c